MSDSNRSGLDTAVRLIFFAALALFSFLAVWDLASSDAENRARAEINAAKYAAGTQEAIERRCGPLENEFVAVCVSEVIESSYEHQRAERDLAAQRDMAKWAFWLLIVSAFGIVLLALTYYEAMKTAQAAIFAADIARQAMIAEHRAWVGITKVSMCSPAYLSEDDGFFFVGVDYTNFGPTPAKNVWVQCEAHFGPAGESRQVFVGRLKEFGDRLRAMEVRTPHMVLPKTPDATKSGWEVRPDRYSHWRWFENYEGQRVIWYIIFVGIRYEVVGDPTVHTTYTAYLAPFGGRAFTLANGENVELSRVETLPFEID